MPLPVDISQLDQTVAIAVMAEDLKANDKVTVAMQAALEDLDHEIHGRPGLPGGISDELAELATTVHNITTAIYVIGGALVTALIGVIVLLATGAIHISS